MSIVSCLVCRKEFYVKPSHLERGWGKYCSKSCQIKSQFKGKFVECSSCGKSVYRSPQSILRSNSGKYFCSKYCQTMWRNSVYVQEKHSNWKNGESAYRYILIRSGLKRECCLCGFSDIRVLSAHHKDHNRSNNKVENLTWLCLNCHYLVHHDREIEEKMRKLLL